jgi:hypothetical protein
MAMNVSGNETYHGQTNEIVSFSLRLTAVSSA